ncbi:enoyl-CoA delta isomerase 2, partial [Menidia menidia]
MAGVSLKLRASWRLLSLRRLLGSRAPRLHTAAGPLMGATVEQFEEAKGRLATLKNDPGNEVKLKIYALFKQATQGPCNTPKPGMLDFVNKAKWDAWKSLGSISQDEARQQYCDLIGSLQPSEAPPPVGAQPAAAAYNTLLVTTQDKITTITLNRPAKKNAITTEMYEEIMARWQQQQKTSRCWTVF